MFSAIYPYLSLLFSALCFYFLQFTIFDSISLQPAGNIIEIKKNFIRPVEMKKLLGWVGGGKGGATNYVILPATMVERRRRFFISNRLKRLGKLNICRRDVIVNKQEFIRKLFRDSTQRVEFLQVYGGLKFKFEVLNIFDYIS